MRGQVDPQASMFSYFSPESRVPEGHPLRAIKRDADAVLAALNREFDELYAEDGRPSIPPERLLKASLLIALYSVRSDRMLCERLDYNILFRWFLDMSLEERGLDQSNFSRLRERLVKTDLACRFFDAVASEARKRKLLSDEHFTVDGTLIEAWASTAKSMRRKDGPPSQGGPDDQGMVNFRGERRSNATHESKTDPEAKLMKKGRGHETKLRYGGHAQGLRRASTKEEDRVAQIEGRKTPGAAKDMLSRQARKRLRPTTLGADKGYHIQQKRKRVEEIFGWMKAYGGLRRPMARGLERVRLHAYMVATAYNLLRMSRLPAPTG